MKTQATYQFIMYPAPDKELGLPMKCIKKTGVGIMPGEFGFCYDPEWFNINGVKYWDGNQKTLFL